MRATTRESYAAAAERLARFAAEATPAQLVEVGDEVLAFAEVLRRQHRLRRALAAPTRSAEDRVGLLRSLLADRVGARSVDLLAALVAGRWTRPAELLDATERLGVDCLLGSAERADELAAVEDELFRFSRIVAGDAPLAAALGDPSAPAARRAELVGALLGGVARPMTVRLAEVALTEFGGRSFGGSLVRLVELVAERRERTVAYVTSAAPLTDDQEQRLAASLTARYGRKVSLKVDVDPRVLGGMRVRVGADLYDGTVSHRLDQVRHAMAN